MSGPGLELLGIGVRFGGLTALADVSVRVEPGTVLGVVGPNGAGKTTLFNVVCGFVPGYRGRMAWDGRPLRPRPHRLARLGIGRTLQGLGLFDGLSVLDNVLVGADRFARRGPLAQLVALPSVDRQERVLRDAAMEILTELGIASHAGQLPGRLPYPVRKRVALARALVARPRLLLLDEPAGGLGDADIDELAALVRALPTRGEGCAVMLVEHHMDLVMRVCRRLVVLDFGRVIAEGTPTEVAADPAVAEAYLGAEAGDPA